MGLLTSWLMAWLAAVEPLWSRAFGGPEADDPYLNKGR